MAIDVIISSVGSSDVAYKASNHAVFGRLLLDVFKKISKCTYPCSNKTDDLKNYLFQMSE